MLESNEQAAVDAGDYDPKDDQMYCLECGEWVVPDSEIDEDGQYDEWCPNGELHFLIEEKPPEPEE